MEDALTTSEALILLEKLRPEFATALGSAAPARFFEGVWALNAHQSETFSPSKSLIVNAPAGSQNAGIADQYRIHPWELETVVNEYFVHQHQGLYRSFSPTDWNHWAFIIGHLRRIENAESAVFSPPENIIDHLFHIGSRQFEWQTGFLNYSELFRGIYVYGQGECAKRFQEKYGISINSFFAYGFSLLSIFLKSPSCVFNLDVDMIGMTSEERDIAATILTGDFQDLRRIAQLERFEDSEIAYKPSILRLKPCIRAGFKDRYLYCPLPDLIMKRVSTGIFYDIVDGGHAVREDYGRRFERYVSLLISTYQASIELYEERSYRTRDGEIRTPDIFLGIDTDGIDVVIECKASRMSYQTRFSDIADLPPHGYDEMTKAVFQIWRHAYHSRIGRASPALHADTVGLVLTLDDWFQGGLKRQEMVLKDAYSLLAKRFPEALPSDRIPIAFANMTEFEAILQTGSADSVIRTLREAASEKRRGWAITSIHRELKVPSQQFKKFAFQRELEKLLPFWSDIRSRAEERGQSQG
ncbi:MAG: hypothetical protein K5799_01395 [Erythrobacter sp.]|nr:hypothetical protein [Erythrobacter sp.]